jgi:assimilatory nitrate reductase catalytic subunit
LQARPIPRLELHPSLAAELGVSEGFRVVAESRRGSAVFEVLITTDIRPDTVFAPFHWGGDQSANLLTTAALDPLSKMPEFKNCAVRLRPA